MVCFFSPFTFFLTANAQMHLQGDVKVIYEISDSVSQNHFHVFPGAYIVDKTGDLLNKKTANNPEKKCTKEKKTAHNLDVIIKNIKENTIDFQLLKNTENYHFKNTTSALVSFCSSNNHFTNKAGLLTEKYTTENHLFTVKRNFHYKTSYTNTNSYIKVYKVRPPPLFL